MSDQSLVGMVGSVVRPVRGGRLPGEVRVVVAGAPELYIAYSDGALAMAARVRVVNNRGSRQVDVVPWP